MGMKYVCIPIEKRRGIWRAWICSAIPLVILLWLLVFDFCMYSLLNKITIWWMRVNIVHIIHKNIWRIWKKSTLSMITSWINRIVNIVTVLFTIRENMCINFPKHPSFHCLRRHYCRTNMLIAFLYFCQYTHFVLNLPLFSL